MAAKLFNAPPVKSIYNTPVADVQFVPVESVYFWAQNPWKHEDAVSRLAELLAIHGQVSPVIVWRKNNVIYKGNHTKKALLYLGANLDKVAKAISTEKYRCFPEDILAKINPGLIKVEFRDFPSEIAANAYGISDNNSSMGGEYNDAILRQLLLTDENYLTSARTGFSEKELKQFKLSATENMERLANIDMQGETAELGEFLILKFENAAILQQFKEATGMAKNERAIDYAKLVELF
jgi:hypothetical protein